MKRKSSTTKTNSGPQTLKTHIQTITCPATTWSEVSFVHETSTKNGRSKYSKTHLLYMIVLSSLSRNHCKFYNLHDVDH